MIGCGLHKTIMDLGNTIKIDMFNEYPYEVKIAIQNGSDTSPYVNAIAHLKNRGLTDEDYKLGFITTTQVTKGYDAVTRVTIFFKDENEAILFKLRFA